jgi:hypothetical protein
MAANEQCRAMRPILVSHRLRWTVHRAGREKLAILPQPGAQLCCAPGQTFYLIYCTDMATTYIPVIGLEIPAFAKAMAGKHAFI